MTPKQGERWLLVTSAYHMPRSVGIFRKAGFTVEPYPVDWRVGGRADLVGFHNIAGDGLSSIDTGVREWVGLVAYWITGKTSGILPRPARSRRIDIPARIKSGSRPGSEFMQASAQSDEKLDLAGMVADLNSLLRLKTTVIGMKMFASVEEMAAILKIRRPSAVHTTDQIVSMASRLGWTVEHHGGGSGRRAVPLP